MRRAYLIGDTYQIRGALKDAGWQWDAERKAWSKPCDPDDDAQWIESRVRALPGIRNRGTFAVEFAVSEDD